MRMLTLSTVALACIAAGLALGICRSTEPTYRDKPLRAWLRDLDSLDRPTWNQAGEVVQALSTNALPTVGKCLRQRDSFVKRRFIALFDRFPVIVIEPADALYDGALQACRILGPAAAPLAPDIVPFLADNRRAEAVKALVAIGASTTPLSEKALENNAPGVRAGAAAALGSLTNSAETAIPALAQHLNDQNAETRLAVVWALGRFGNRAASACERLSALTNDPSYAVSEQAKTALARIASGERLVATKP